jgi:hypothetical protein
MINRTALTRSLRPIARLSPAFAGTAALAVATLGLTVAAGAAGTAPATGSSGGSAHQTSVPATVSNGHTDIVPNDNIVKTSGHYVFDPTTVTGFKVSKKAFNHCNLPKVSFTITNTTSVTQQVKFSPRHGGAKFGPPIPPGGMGGACVDLVSNSHDEFTLARNPNASLSEVIVKR